MKSWKNLIVESKNFKPLIDNSKNLMGISKYKKCGIEIDFSRQNLNQHILNKLIELAEESNLIEKKLNFFKGNLNFSSNKISPLHMALRAKVDSDYLWKKEINHLVGNEMERFLHFSEQLREDKVLGWDKTPIKNVIVFGLGGSILGSRLAVDVLSDEKNSDDNLNIFFVSNPDCHKLNLILMKLKAKETLFLILSKSLKTPEIMILKDRGSSWLTECGCPKFHLNKHFAVVTSNVNQSFTIDFLDEHSFHIWEWVGGRFSVWSAIGLPIALTVGKKKFEQFLEGAREMDNHFLNSELKNNLPVITALLSVWNRNFLGFPSYAISTYSSKLDLFVPYIQQLDMESLGKNVHLNGKNCSIETGQSVWGGPGIEGQHAYFQLFHQGKQIIPVDFYGVKNDSFPTKIQSKNQNFVNLNLKSQADSLCVGDKEKNFEGNRPSTIFWLDSLSPKILGSLLSMHEHRIFSLACIWDINPFDQPGVELGKKLLANSLSKY